MRRLIAPSSVETLTFPTDVRELVQQLSHHYAPVYDNVDQLPKWLSDALCRAVTGEGFSKRELYSEDEDVIYSYRRAIMLNGVNVAARRSDLLDRTILLSLVRIPRDERREERAFWAEFEAARPSILGGILDSLALALACYPGIDIPWLERMADFTRFGAAVSQALGFGATAFLEAYSGNVVVQTKEAVEGHVVGASVLALMEGRTEWRGTPSELLAAPEKAGEAAHLCRRNVSGRARTTTRWRARRGRGAEVLALHEEAKASRVADLALVNHLLALQGEERGAWLIVLPRLSRARSSTIIP